MTGHLFLITIGPVQEFIAAARRTRDLWAGSQLLSALSRTAAQTLRAIPKVTLIFPAQEDLDLATHDVVNRIVAQLPAEADPNTVGQQVEAAVKAKLTTLATKVFKNKQRIRWPSRPVSGRRAKASGSVGAGAMSQRDPRTRAKTQVDDLIEITWAAAPLADDANAFPSSRKSLEAALAARKHTHTFTQPAWGLPMPKSSIDGMRESVIPEDDYPARGDSPSVHETKIKQLFYRYGAGRAERLSGVDLFKRHYRATEDQADFPSTSHFAALPLLWRTHAAGKDIRYGLSRYLDKLRTAYKAQDGERQLNMLRLDMRFATPVTLYNYDASLLFANRLEEELDGAPLIQAREALASYLRESLVGTPDPYYALLLADGDNMGKVIDNQSGLATQQALSLALDTFARGVRDIVESADHHRGALVYAGGDDVLAFLPLDTALACAHKLHESYKAQMQGFLTEQGTPSTLSVGIAICHHLEPLSDALKLVRKAEQAAKSQRGKDSLAIILSKRGGSDRIIAGGWGEAFYARLLHLITLHRKDAIPDSAAFDLNDLALRVGRTLPPEALKAEALRIVKRKRGQHGNDGDPNAELLALAATLPATTSAAPRWDITEFATELIITREFARALGLLPVQKGVPA